MGLVGMDENGVTDSLGRMNKYRRMDSSEEVDDEAASHHQQMERRKRTRKYVFACAVFASLNSVLLGYGAIVLTWIRITHGSPDITEQYSLCGEEVHGGMHQLLWEGTMQVRDPAAGLRESR